MKKTLRKLNNLFHSAHRISATQQSKFVFFSDAHRGTNDWADDFSGNANVYYHALSWYLEQGFHYFELGDGDELWENTDFRLIRRAHSHIFDLMREYHQKKRLWMLFGNHDIERKNSKKVKEQLFHYHSQHKNTSLPLLPEIIVHEALVLNYEDKFPIFLIHGHQGDLFADSLWRFSRFMVRHLWKKLQLWGVKDPTSAAVNNKIQSKIEKRLRHWIISRQVPIICGHTHRPVFPSPHETPYFNAGSAVHPRCITGLELENGELSLIKWMILPDHEGCLRIQRILLEGPVPLKNYFSDNK